jgi:hypothetical protein
MLNLGLGVNSRHSVSLYDADAQAFINATALTGTTEKTAVNNLVKNLKSYGLWSKMKAIYPFVSDTVNTISYSQDFSNGVWSKNLCSITSNSTTAPDGTNTGAKLVTDTNTGAHRVTQAITTNASTYTFSIYAKAAELPAILIYNSTNSNGKLYNLSNGTLGSTLGTVTNSTITNAGNGWYRCTVTMPCTAASQTWMVYGSTDATSGYFFTGNGVNGVYIWGSQLEESATATTYQPIATTPANRFVSQFKYNLKDARDLDAAFRLAFNGTWTYSKQGATPNGVNGYATTYFNTATNLTQFSSSMSVYSRTDTTSSGEVMGCDVGGFGRYFRLLLKSSTTPNTRVIQNGTATAATYNGVANSLGLFLSSRTTSTKLILQQNSTILNTNTILETSLLPSQNVFIGAYSNNGSPSNYTPYQIAFSHLSDGLTDTEATNLYTSVQLFQQELSRYVGVPIVSDANAQAFLDAAVITDQTQANAVNTLVTDLKSYGLWTKMKAIYPFVGGTATTHKWNLKDPRDLDAAYRLAFSGAWTHSSTGALPNGANAFADTYFIPSTALSLNSSHLGFYSRTNNTTGIDDLSAVIVGDTQNMRIIINLTGSLYVDLNSANERVTGANANSTGFYQASRTSSTSLKVYKNNTTFGTNTSANTGTLPIISMYIGAAHRGTGAINYSNRECAFATLGDGLNDTEATNLYTAVQKFETSLNRQI